MFPRTILPRSAPARQTCSRNRCRPRRRLLRVRLGPQVAPHRARRCRCAAKRRPDPAGSWGSRGTGPNS